MGRGTNSLEMVLESHVEVKGIPSVNKANSDESSAAWGRRKSKGWNRKAAEEEGEPRARCLLQLELGAWKLRYRTRDIFCLLVTWAGLEKPAFKLTQGRQSGGWHHSDGPACRGVLTLTPSSEIKLVLFKVKDRVQLA